MSIPPVSELRIDPIVGRRVYIAEDRAGRPNDFLGRGDSGGAPVAELTLAECPFCVGHEEQTPEPSFEVHDTQGDWRVRVVPNKYPAVTGDAIPESDTDAILQAGAPWGQHEVIIESPRHVRGIADLSVEDLAVVLQVYRARLQHWESDVQIQQAMLFKNVGSTAGASLEHTHSQLLALPYVPPVMTEELTGAKRFFENNDTCIFCKLIEAERNSNVRMIADSGGYIALSAYAARQPYETWILPTTHSADFTETSDADLKSLATILRQVLVRLESLIPNPNYNLLLHTVPFRQDDRAYYHWHLELIPRTTQLAGLEWGAGVHINPLSPERAAAQLREGH